MYHPTGMSIPFQPFSLSAPFTQISKDREHELECCVRHLLKEAGSDTTNAVIQFVESAAITQICELESVIQRIVQSALIRLKNITLYVTIVVALHGAYSNSQIDGVCAKGFLRALLNICQHEYEDTVRFLKAPRRLSATNVYNAQRRRYEQQQTKMTALLRFVGGLYEHKLIATKVVGHIFHELIGLTVADYPDENMVSFACELLVIAGQTLQSTTQGSNVLDTICRRLEDLAQMHENTATAKMPSCEVKDKVKGALELHESGWIRLIIQLEEATNEDGFHIILGRRMSGEPCVTLEASLQDAEPEQLCKNIGSALGVHSCRLKIILPSGNVVQ